jgi:hypothetical protein
MGCLSSKPDVDYVVPFKPKKKLINVESDPQKSQFLNPNTNATSPIISTLTSRKILINKSESSPASIPHFSSRNSIPSRQLQNNEHSTGNIECIDNINILNNDDNNNNKGNSNNAESLLQYEVAIPITLALATSENFSSCDSFTLAHEESKSTYTDSVWRPNRPLPSCQKSQSVSMKFTEYDIKYINFSGSCSNNNNNNNVDKKLLQSQSFIVSRPVSSRGRVGSISMIDRDYDNIDDAMDSKILMRQISLFKSSKKSYVS